MEPSSLYDIFDAIDDPRYRKAVINAVMAVLDVQLLPQFKDKCEALMRDRSKYEKHAKRSRKIDAVIIRMIYPMVEMEDRALIMNICAASAAHDDFTSPRNNQVI